MKVRVNIAVIGHLDHGKSTLIGRLLVDTRSVPEAKIREAGANPAYLLDSFSEEREKNFTLDAAQAIVRTRNAEYNFIDCPGHKTLIKNMLSGSSQAEWGIVVVSAKQNEGITDYLWFILNLSRLLGIRRLCFVISKMDLVYYSEKRFSDLKRKVENFLDKNRFCRRNGFVPVSAYCGMNIAEKCSEMRWHNGQPLLPLIRKYFPCSGNTTRKTTRISVQGVEPAEKKIVLWGRVENGCVSIRDKLRFAFSGRKGTVHAISIGRIRKRVACRGECVRIAVVGIEVNGIARGEIIYTAGYPLTVTKTAEASFFLFQQRLKRKRLFLKHGLKEYRCDIVRHHTENGIHHATIVSDSPLAIDHTSKRGFLNRFIVLNRSKNIIGFGVFEK